MRNHGDGIQRRAKPVRRRRGKGTERHSLLFLGKNKPGLGQRLVKPPRA